MLPAVDSVAQDIVIVNDGYFITRKITVIGMVN
jgi:hypothetical protein